MIFKVSKYLFNNFFDELVYTFDRHQADALCNKFVIFSRSKTSRLTVQTAAFGLQD